MKISFEKLFVVVLLAVFFLLNFFSAQKESLTYDEPLHLQAGLEEWQKHNFSLDPMMPPLIREIGVLPIVLGVSPGRQLLPARMMVTGLAVVLGLLIYHYGRLPALLLYVFEPTILTHSHYLTLDIGASLFFALSYFAYLNFLKENSLKNALIWGLLVGCSLTSKATVIPTLFLSFILTALIKRKKLTRSILKRAIIAGFFSLLVIWLIYFFTLAPVIAERQDSTRLSETIMTLHPEVSALILWLKQTHLPLGYFLATLKNSFVFNLKPHLALFLGNLYPVSHWYFLPIIYLLKTPMPLLILLGFGMFVENLIYLFIPILAVFFIYCLGTIQPYLRYLLPIYPFIILIAGLGAERLAKIRFGKIILGLLFGWYLIGTMRIYPHFISYANELSGPKNTRVFLFADSNYDWGQGLVELERYLKAKEIKNIELSYFGTDSPEAYGLVANHPFAEKFEDRCPLYLISATGGSALGGKVKEKGEKIIAISISNYYYCGYYQNSEFAKDKVKEIVADSILVFK